LIERAARNGQRGPRIERDRRIVTRRPTGRRPRS
jgi:hypothetical protein